MSVVAVAPASPPRPPTSRRRHPDPGSLGFDPATIPLVWALAMGPGRIPFLP